MTRRVFIDISSVAMKRFSSLTTILFLGFFGADSAEAGRCRQSLSGEMREFRLISAPSLGKDFIEADQALSPAQVIRDYADPTQFAVFREWFSLERNADYVREVRQEDPTRDYFFSGNILIQDLNKEVMRSKALVSATQHLYQVFFAEALASAEIEIDGKRVPLRPFLDLSFYDYKTLRFATISGLTDRQRRAIRGAWRRLTAEVGARFWLKALTHPNYVKMIARDLGQDLRGIVDEPAYWNLAGAADSADLAAITANFGRIQFKSETGAIFYEFADIASLLSETLRQGEALRAQIVSALSRRALEVSLSRTNSRSRSIPLLMDALLDHDRSMITPSSSVVQLVRKAKISNSGRPGKSPNTIRRAIEESIQNAFDFSIQDIRLTVDSGLIGGPSGEPVEIPLAIALRQYLNFVDSWKVPFLNPVRTPLHLRDAEFDVLSFDYVGQGSRNTYELMQAVHQSEDPRIVVGAAREAEKRATSLMESLDAQTRLLANGDPIDRSGDEGFIKFSHNLTHQELMDRVRTLKTPGSFRLTYMPKRRADGSSIAPSLRMQLIERAEDSEHLIRALLEEQISAEVLEKFTFVLFVDVLGTGTESSVDVLVGGRGTSNEKAAIFSALKGILQRSEFTRSVFEFEGSPLDHVHVTNE